MKITFLRHCTSIFNELKTSDKDCDLSEAGKTQAKDISGNYDIIFCSIMKRTTQTLVLSKLTGKRVIYTELCREWKRDICDFLPGEDETKWETQEELEARCADFLDCVKGMAEGLEKVLVITHADFVFCLNKGDRYLENGEFYNMIV